MKFANKYKVFIISFLIPFLTSIIALFLFNLFPFDQNSSDIFTSTGNDAYITNYFKLYDYIHGIYTPHNIKDIVAFYLTDPSNLIVLLFPRTMLLSILSILFCVKLGLSGLFASIYFSKTLNYSNNENTTNFDNINILLLSVAYSLSNYMISYGTNISFLSVIAIFPLVVLYLEKLSSEYKWIPYYIILSISFYLNVYTTGIVVIFTYIYLFTLKYSSKKDIFKTILYKCTADILSIGTACFAIIPAIRSSVSSSFFQKLPPFNAIIIYFWEMIHQFLFLSKPSALSKKVYGIDLYIGILCLFLIFLYITNSKIETFAKIKKLSVLAVLFTGTIMSGPNSIFNLFKDTYNNTCIFLFVLIFYMLTIARDLLAEYESISKISIAISTLASLALIILSMFFSKNYDSSSSFIYSIELIILYSILLYLISSKIKNYNYLLFVTVLLGIVEIVFSFVLGVNSLEDSGKTYSSSFSNTQYELEKNDKNATVLNFDVYDDYFNPVLNVFNKIDYVTYSDASVIPDLNLESKTSIGNVDIYSNPFADNRFIYTSSNVLDWTYSKSSTYSSMNYLASLISGQKEDIFELVNNTPTLISINSAKDSNYKETTIDYTFDSEGYIYSNQTVTDYLGKYSDNKPIRKAYKSYVYKEQYSHAKSSYFYKFNQEAYKKFIDSIPYLDSNTTIERDGYILNSINDYPLYDIYVDGKYVEPISIDNCLWCIPITSGNHTIERQFHQTRHNNTLLICISILSIILAIIATKIRRIAFIQFIYRKTFVFVRENYVYITTILATSSIFLLACYLNTCVPFGNLSGLRSDGYGQTYPAIQSMINSLSIKSLKPSTMDFSTFIFSCGGNPISSFIGVTISLIYRAFIWTNDGKLYSTIMSAIYLVYSGPSIIFYLTHKYSGKRFDKKNPYLIMIALLYTLSSYSIGYYIFNNFLYGVYTPMIIYALERMIYKKKPLLYIFFLSFIMVRGYYSAFLLCEFIGLYFITLDHKNIKGFFKNTLQFIISSLLAAGLGAFNLLPSFITVLNSPYQQNDSIDATSVSNGINIFSTVFKTINQYQVGVKPIYISSDNGMVNIYAGLLPLLFIPIYALNKNVKLSIRFRKLFICFLLFWAFGDSIFNFILHGFHHQSNVPNRFSIFFIFMIIEIFSETIISLRDISYKRIMYAITSVFVILCTLWLAYPDKNKTSLVLSLVFIACYTIIFAISYIKKLDKAWLSKIISYIAIIELLISSFIGFSGTLGHSNEILEDNMKSIGRLKRSFTNTDDSIFISEYVINSSDNFNMGKINNLNTITGFSSELNSKVYDMAQFWGLFASANTINYLSGNPVADLMLHVKYQFINSNDSEYGNASIYNLIDEQNNMQLYENPYYLPVGFVTDSKVQEWYESDIENYYSLLDYQNGLSQAVCDKDIYTEIHSEDDDDETYLNTTLDDSTILNSKNLNVEIGLNEKYKGKVYIFFGSRMAYVGNTEESDDNHFNIVLHDFANGGDDINMPIFLGILNEDVLSEMHSKLSESTIQDIKKTNTYFSGKIDVKKSGILYLSLPNYSNMKIYIDGKETPHFDYIKATGINIEEGQHTIKVEGTNGNYSTCVIITITALILIIIYNMIIKKITNNSKKSDEPDTTHEDKKAKEEKNNMKKAKSYFIHLKKLNVNYILSFIIPFIILLSSIVYSGFNPFGPRDVITANDQSEYLQWFYELYDRVYSGKSILGYSTNSGTGYDFSTILTYYVSDPTNLLALLFPRAALPAVLNILYVIKVSLSGLFMSIYLSKTNIQIIKNSNKKNKEIKENKKPKKEKKDIVIGGVDEGPTPIQKLINHINLPILSMSLIYALSNYMLGPGLNIAMVGAVMIFPLIILGLELLVYEKKKKMYIITYTLSFLFNYKITIISTIFMLLYIVVLNHDSFKSFIKAFLRKIGCDLVVYMLSAVIILNNISCSSWKNELVLPDKIELEAKLFDVIKMLSTGIKPANLLLSGYNLYIYCGIVTLLFFTYFIFNNNIKLLFRVKYTILYIILFVGFMIPSINTILNGFIYHDGLSSTYAYVFIFISIVITFIEYKYIKDTKAIRVIIPSIITTGLIVASLFLCKSYDSPSYFIKSLEFIFFYSIIMMIYSNKSLAKWLFTILLSCILIIELTSSYIPNMKTLGSLTYPYNILESYKKATVSEYIHDKYGSSSTLVYKAERSTHTPLEVTLMGYDYIYWVGEESKIYPTLEVVDDYMDFKICKSKSSYNSYFINKDITNYTYDKYSIIDSLNNLSENYLHSPSSLISIPYEEAGGNYANGTNYIYITPSEGGDLYFNYGYISNVNNTDGENNVQFIQEVNKNRFKFKKGLYKFSEDNYNETINNLQGYRIDLNKTNTIHTDNEGYITLGIKYNLGWNIKVNDKKVKCISFLNDGMIIPVEKGENSITISFIPIIFYLGLTISCITLIISILVYKKASRKDRKEK